MKPTTTPKPLLSRLDRSQAGHTLVISATIATIVTAMVGTAMMRTTASTRLGARATNYASTARAVDGVLEYAFGVWKSATVQKDMPLVRTVPADNAVLSGPGPDLPGFTYTTPLRIDPVDAYGSPANAPIPAMIFLQDYPGWQGRAYNYVASVRLQPVAGLQSTRPEPTGAKRIFQYIEVPLFQSMYFYENDLEIYRPAPMIVGGLVHSNSRLMLSGMTDTNFVDLDFRNNLSYAGGSESTPGYTTSEPPIGGPQWAGIPQAQAAGRMEAPTFSGGGEEEQLSKVERYEPLGTKPAGALDPDDSDPNNDSFRELIEPPVTSSPDKPEIARRRLFNKAGVVMTINGTSVTIETKNGTSLSSSQISTLRSAFTGKNTIYDQREGRNVDVANINMSTVTGVLNGANGFNGVLYIHDTTSQSSGDPEPKTLRLKNGGVLPNGGLTVASQNPVYVQGDYNTGTTTDPTAVPANASGNPNNTDSPVKPGYTRVPAAVIADAVMLLSNRWNDANAAKAITDSGRDASNTTYNMAILAGVVPSGWDPDGPGGVAAYGYSGGANNYPRFLEDWGGKSCTYHGSMVQLFQSKIFTGKWDTGVIYRPPNRRWNFDTLFKTTPPPGSLDAVAIARGGWTSI